MIKERRVKVFKIRKIPRGEGGPRTRKLLTFINTGEQLNERIIEHLQAWASVEEPGILELVKLFKFVPEEEGPE